VTSRAAASRYARALFDVTLKEGADVEKVQRELDQFVSLFRSHDVLSQTLGNPAIPASKKKALVASVVAAVLWLAFYLAIGFGWLEL